MQSIADQFSASFSDLREAVREGMMLFTHFWNNTIQEVSRGELLLIRTCQPPSQFYRNAWAWQSGRNLCFNVSPISASSGNVLRWTRYGVFHGTAHEAGHYFFGPTHLEGIPNYYSDTRYSHVMSLSGTNFVGSFSPHEIWMLRNRFGIKRDAQHPFVKRWMNFSETEKQKEKQTLLNIVSRYYELGINRNLRLHSLIGDSEIDSILRSLRYLSRSNPSSYQ